MNTMFSTKLPGVFKIAMNTRTAFNFFTIYIRIKKTTISRLEFVINDTAINYK